MRAGRHASRRGVRGQVMLLFALILPVILGFIALSMSASLLLNAKAKLDQSALSSSVSAASDACMSSKFSFDIYKCSAGTSTNDYNTPTWSVNLPEPPFPGSGAPNGFICNNTDPAPYNKCLMQEHQAAQDSAEFNVQQVLSGDYPNLTVVKCPADNSYPDTATCQPMSNSNTVAYQVNISYWYYYDTDDCPGGSCGTGPPPTSSNDNQTDDIPLGQALSGASGGHLPCYDTVPGTPDCVTYLPDEPALSNSDFYPVPAGATSSLICPATGQGGRQVSVTIWFEYDNPLSGLLGIGRTNMASTQISYGCSSGT